MEETDKQNTTKIIIVGPESTGKSTLAKNLAEHYKTVWVREYLREFAEDKYSNNKQLIYRDNIAIAKGQKQLEQKAIDLGNRLIFCDTDILQTIVYSIVYYGKIQAELEEIAHSNLDSIYLLANLDVPWEDDPLRDKPNEREHIFNLIKSTLIKYNKTFYELKGEGADRVVNAISIIDNLTPRV